MYPLAQPNTVVDIVRTFCILAFRICIRIGIVGIIIFSRGYVPVIRGRKKNIRVGKAVVPYRPFSSSLTGF